MRDTARYSDVIDASGKLTEIRDALCDSLEVLEQMQAGFSEQLHICVAINRAALAMTATIMMIDQALNILTVI